MTGNSRNWSRFLGSGKVGARFAAAGARCRYLSAAICIAVRGAPASASTSTCSTSGVFSGRPQNRACNHRLPLDESVSVLAALALLQHA